MQLYSSRVSQCGTYRIKQQETWNDVDSEHFKEIEVGELFYGHCPYVSAPENFVQLLLCRLLEYRYLKNAVLS